MHYWQRSASCMNKTAKRQRANALLEGDVKPVCSPDKRSCFSFCSTYHFVLLISVIPRLIWRGLSSICTVRKRTSGCIVSSQFWRKPWARSWSYPHARLIALMLSLHAFERLQG